MGLLKQSTARNRLVLMTLASDHVTGATGLTLTITASKDGGAFASITPTVTELTNGWYNLALTTTHTNTLGEFAMHITGGAADPTDTEDQVLVDLPGNVTTAAIVTAILTAAIESGVTVQQMLEAIGAATAGDYDAGTGTFRAVGNHGTTRLTTVLSSNNRTNTPSL